jgi:hypothetical protein
MLRYLLRGVVAGLVCCMPATVHAAPAPVPAPPAATTTTSFASDSPAAELAAFGLAIDVPADWVRVRETVSSTAVGWGWRTADAGDVAGGNVHLSIQFEPARNRTLEQCARETAEKLHATVAADADARAIVDGQRTALLTQREDALHPQATHMLLVKSGDRLYALRASAPSEAALPHEKLTQLVRGVRFIPATSPLADDRLNPTVLKLDNRKFEIGLLPAMRLTVRPDLPNAPVEIRLADLRDPEEHRVMTVIVGALPAGANMDDIARESTEKFGQKWHPLEGEVAAGSRVLISEPFKPKSNSPALASEKYRRAVIVRCADGSVVSLMVAFGPVEGEELRHAEKIADAMLRTVRVAPAK